MIPADYFVHPTSGVPLQWNEAQTALVSADNQEHFPFQQGVLHLLPIANTENDTFDYADHYQKDAEAFDYFAGWEDPAAVHENRRLHEMILRHGPDRPKRVLDVGCGAAWVAKHFSQKEGAEVFSMDISTVNPTKAVARYNFAGHYGLVADVFHLPFRKGLFDFIIASEIIEHVPDPAAFLAILSQQLAPGGKLVVTTPHAEKLAYSLCIHCNRPTPHHAHLHSFTAESIRTLLPISLQTGATTRTFMNKLLLHGRTHPVLRQFPFTLWRITDRLASFFVNKTARLMLVVTRPH